MQINKNSEARRSQRLLDLSYMGPSVDFKHSGLNPNAIKSALSDSESVKICGIRGKSEINRSVESFDLNFPALSSKSETEKIKFENSREKTYGESEYSSKSQTWTRVLNLSTDSNTDCNHTISPSNESDEIQKLKSLVPKTSSKSSKLGRRSSQTPQPSHIDPSTKVKRSGSMGQKMFGTLICNDMKNVSFPKSKGAHECRKSNLTISLRFPPENISKNDLKPQISNNNPDMIQLSSKSDRITTHCIDPAWDDDSCDINSATSGSTAIFIGEIPKEIFVEETEVRDSWEDEYDETSESANSTCVYSDNIDCNIEDEEEMGVITPTIPVPKDNSVDDSYIISQAATERGKVDVYTSFFAYSASLEREEAFLKKLGWEKQTYYDSDVDENEFVITESEIQEFWESARLRMMGLSGSGNIFTIFAGFPTTTTFGGTSFVTTEPAPTVDPSPMVTPGRMIAPPPIHVHSN
ncbi:hypothetical protein HK096_010349 [Nowakowskiella sp. JEL0078]|nr:hypothetical protein HK096_010349 [Nowakowskiella sp. JEL0078]